MELAVCPGDPAPAPGRWCPEGLRLDPGRTQAASRGAPSEGMEAVGPILQPRVCTPATGPPNKGRMGSRWRADASRGGSGADASAGVSLSGCWATAAHPQGPVHPEL